MAYFLVKSPKIIKMKKQLLTLAFILSATIFANAQSKFSVGPTVGAGWTSLSDVDNSRFKTGVNFGLSSVFSAAEHFGIGLDVKYSIEGAKAEDGGVKTDIDLHYLRIPLKAIYFFNDYKDKLRPKIFAGPSLGFLSSAKINNNPGVSDFDIKPYTESIDIALFGGVGLNYRMADKTWLNVDVTYTNGIKDIIQENQSVNSPFFGRPASDKTTTRNAMINVGVLFGL